MSESPLPRLDPQRLRDERHDVDLGADADFDQVKVDPDDEERRRALIDDATAGVSPPAR